MLSFAGYPFTPLTPELRLSIEDWWREEAPDLWSWPGYSLEGLHHVPVPDRPKPEAARLNTLVWPTGASRWAVFHGLMGDANAAAVQAACGTSAPTAQTLLMKDEKTGNQVSTSMFLVDIRCVYDFDDSSSPGLDGAQKGKRLWWLTLVDERFFWWQVNLNYTYDSDWSVLLANLVSAATNGESVSVPAVPADYGAANAVRWESLTQPLPLLIDAAARSVGFRFVRMLDGTLKYVTATTALADDTARWSAYSGQRVLGTKVALSEVIGSVPASVNVGFGQPPLVSNVTLGSLALTQYGGATGVASAAGWIFGDLDSSTGAGPRGLYATQAAKDYYLWCLSLTDATFRNVQPLTGPTGIEDRIEWEYQPGRRSFADKDAILSDRRLPPERQATRVVKCDIADRNLYGNPNVVIAEDPWFFARITGGDDASGYSWQRVHLTAPNTWTDSVVVPATGTNNAWRAPSNVGSPTLPTISVNQVMVMRPAADDPGDFEMMPWGSQEGGSVDVVTDVVVASATTVCNGDGTLTTTVTLTITKNTLNFNARDFVLTVT